MHTYLLIAFSNYSENQHQRSFQQSLNLSDTLQPISSRCPEQYKHVAVIRITSLSSISPVLQIPSSALFQPAACPKQFSFPSQRAAEIGRISLPFRLSFVLGAPARERGPRWPGARAQPAGTCGDPRQRRRQFQVSKLRNFIRSQLRGGGGGDRDGSLAPLFRKTLEAARPRQTVVPDGLWVWRKAGAEVRHCDIISTVCWERQLGFSHRSGSQDWKGMDILLNSKTSWENNRDKALRWLRANQVSPPPAGTQDVPLDIAANLEVFGYLRPRLSNKTSHNHVKHDYVMTRSLGKLC